MATLAAQIRAALQEHEIEARLYTLGRASAARAALERRQEEARSRVGFWDKVNIFTDSTDEAEAKQVEGELERLDADLLQRRAELDRALDAIAAHFPPFALARRIDRITRAIYAVLKVEGLLFKSVDVPDEVFERLEELGQEVTKLYVADFDLEGLVRALGDEARCAELARQEPPRVEPDPVLGFKPLTQEALLTLLAGRVLNGPYFQGLDDLRQRDLQVKELHAAWEQARSDVSLWSTINVFSRAWDEVQRDQAAEALRRGVHALRQRNEEVHHALETVLDTYPPLGLYNHVGELTGALTASRKAEEHNLNERGQVVTTPVVNQQAMVFAALGRLKRAFARAFPGVPLPSEVELRGARDERASRQHAPSAEVMRAFAEHLNDQGGPAGLDRCLLQVAMKQRLETRLRGLRGAISVWDRLVLGARDEQRVEAELNARRKWLEDAVDAEWDGLVELARRAGWQIPLLRLRDYTIYATWAINKIHTDSGASSVPKSCSVYGREEAYRHLGVLAETLQHTFGVTGNRQDLINHLVDALQRPPRVVNPQDVYASRAWADIVALIAEPLRGTPFLDIALHLHDLLPRKTEVSGEMARTVAQISFWDKINIFSSTPEERRRDELEDVMQQLDAQVADQSGRLHALLDQALMRYPPALLYYSVGAVYNDVSNIRAVCRSRTVTERSADGKSTRTRTEYYCDLVGKTQATRQMSAFSARVVHVFGTQPGYHELLAFWARLGGPSST